MEIDINAPGIIALDGGNPLPPDGKDLPVGTISTRGITGDPGSAARSASMTTLSWSICRLKLPETGLAAESPTAPEGRSALD
ncbi:MAG: hypothetical protein VX663_04710 [Pseudomonadota bacterium]|nr:hypothetical protein [Pseudomonadota bacterium]